ncbi:MAG: 50S ribosomal protein L28 [Myxococcota bacterium]|jgi:large subunit ribosomal protein L28|nr:50S ribosomal protein L28 [Myxococcales bacterium]MBF95539.1 50S ribosomal protein L28 [Myxococcales bacterium]MEC7751157.1 50S ribosomal protein L28 [Myxococcota bacterium]|tara:strand:+ start:2141 stop:2365 length:225 start_codon:yes stop_codon:yes gene_type:complete
MAVCALTGKKGMSGNRVSHSNIKTKRRREANLQSKRFYIPEQNRWVRLRVSTRAIRTIDKIGLLAFAQKAGIKI